MKILHIKMSNAAKTVLKGKIIALNMLEKKKFEN